MKNGMALRVLGGVVAGFAAVCVLAATALAENRQIPAGGAASPLAVSTAPLATGSNGFPEFLQEDDADEGPDAFNGTIEHSTGPGRGSDASSGPRAKSRPDLGTSFEGLGHYQQRFANNGNQFSVEPPDQGLCVGNGFVVEAVNDVLNVYSTTGLSLLPSNAVGGAVDLNTFFGYPAAINRTTGVRGQVVTDPSCLYDAQTQRFYLVVLTLEVVPRTGAFTTVNHLDVAVSNSSNPTGAWTVYRVDVTHDGSANPSPANACPCLGDYPHIGADANGFYVTTNAYPFNGAGFDGAQIYAFSKRQLAAGAASVNMVHLDTFGKVAQPSDAGATQPGFTVWPAQSPGPDSFEGRAHGTEYLLSSNAADEATTPVSGDAGPRTSNQLVAWALTNTRSLDAATPAVSLSNTVLGVNRYGVPPKATQPGSGSAPGQDTPQGFCLNDETTVTAAGVGCWRLLVTPAAHNRGPEVVSRLDANDTRMQQVTFANGKLWGALDTAVSFDANPSNNRAGIAWAIVKPDVGGAASLSANVALQGTFGMADMDLTYPAIGVTSSGRGVVAMTATGPTQFPSSAYSAIDANAGIGDVHIAAAGAATQDGFSGYRQQVGNIRPRWGDYGATAVDGNTIWIASEYIAHACSYATWGGPFFADGVGDTRALGTCAGSSSGQGPRTALANWSTRISQLTP
ncbi:MAG: hypothetical protein ACJ77E_17630 [Gaiellaceae bacterium]